MGYYDLPAGSPKLEWSVMVHWVWVGNSILTAMGANADVSYRQGSLWAVNALQ